MKTLLVVDTYAAISDFLPAMWPHYEKAGCDIAGGSRTNAPTTFPVDVPVITYGEDVFKRFCEHKSHTLLNDRMIGMMEQMLHDPRFEQYTDFSYSIWSVLFTKPLPELPAPLTLHTAGGPQYDRGFTAPYYFHQPFWFDRPTGELLVTEGRKLMANDENEGGSNDFMFGLMVSRLGLTWQEVPAYTCNRLDHPRLIEEARKALKEGQIWWVHGVKTPDQLNAILR